MMNKKVKAKLKKLQEEFEESGYPSVLQVQESATEIDDLYATAIERLKYMRQANNQRDDTMSALGELMEVAETIESEARYLVKEIEKLEAFIEKNVPGDE